MVKKKTGRKPLWDELEIADRLDMIKGWAMQGSTDADIMKMLGVGKDVFYKWKKEKSEFKEALKKGRYDSNGEILKSAFKQVTGYFIKEQQVVKLRDQYGNEEFEIVELDKFITPNPAMTIFMLKNRLPEYYKDKPTVDDSQDIEDDGFIDAINHTADDVWSKGEDNEKE